MIIRLAFIELIWIACAVFTAQAKPVDFTSEYIEAIYHELPKKEDGSVIDSIYRFSVRVTEVEDRIQDLGVRIDNLLFDNPQIKSFVERKVLELLLAKDYKEVQNILTRSKCRLIYNGIDYDRGLFWSIKQSLDVFGNCTSYSYRSDVSYHYLDLSDGRNRLEILFPTNIQIVTDKNKMELELELESLVQSEYDVDIFAGSQANKKYNQIDGLYVNTRNFMHTESVSDVTYYNYNGFSFEPIFSLEYAIESFTNLFHFANENSASIDLDIKQWMYGNQSKEFIISLDQLIAFCQVNDINVYVGIEGKEDNIMESTVLLECKSMKYLHLLHVKTDVSTLFKNSRMAGDYRGKMMVNLYAYVPTDNVENIFGDQAYQKRSNKFEIFK